MRKLLPVLLALIGLGAGAAAGLKFRPDPEALPEAAGLAGGAAPCGPPAEAAEGHAAATAFDYVKLNNQFVVPVVEEGDVAALVILSISLEVSAGTADAVYAIEPKLRDAFLRVLFDHANAGGFSGAFTRSDYMDGLRLALLEVARKSLGASVSRVLIVDIVRQDA